MGEKRGETEKLINDYNTAGVLEVFLNNKTWYRVTTKDFRSFDGKRRITEPVKPQGRGEIFNVPMKTEEYNGPTFLWGTNTQVLDTRGEGKILTGAYWEKAHKISGSRG